MNSLHSYIRSLAAAVEEPAPAEKKGEKLIIHTIGLSFNAEPFKIVQQRIKQDEAKGLFDKNFQWMQMVLIMSNKDETLWHKYILKLKPDGTKDGKGETVFSDEKGNSYPDRPIYVTPDEVLRMFPNLLRGPDLDPGFPIGKVDFKEIPKNIKYVNSNDKDKGNDYRPDAFEREFENAVYTTKDGSKVHMYLLMEEGSEMHTPLGKKIQGVNPSQEPAEKEAAFRMAVRAAKEKKDGPISGGFSIVKDLFYKQHEDQKKKNKTN